MTNSLYYLLDGVLGPDGAVNKLHGQLVTQTVI